jgi:putative toxin-antitoxin system antitoxin component (TIGR02293 family)
MKNYKKLKKASGLAHEPDVAYTKTARQFVVEGLLEVSTAQVGEPLNRVAAFRKGFKKKSFEKLKETTGLDYQTLATALSVSTKTLQRTEVFDLVQSEKMYELACLYAMGMSYFGEEGFRRWMERPLFTLGNRKPIDLIDVSEGLDLLQAEIMRLQHGVAV